MKYRFLIGIVLLVTAAASIAAYLTWFNPPPLTKVTGYIGGSKANLLHDPAVVNILRSKYQLEVEYQTLGGLDQVCAIALPYDYLWPGTEVSVEEYKDCHGGRAKYDSLLLSPIVMYSWGKVTTPLANAGYIEKKPDGLYYVPMEQFVPLLIEGKTGWPGTIQAFGNVSVMTTDPTQSNSGQVFAALLAKLLQQQRAVAFEQTLPDVKKYIDNLGFKPSKTADLFKLCLGKGMGACPIFVAYESLLPDFVNDNNIKCEELKALQAIYPIPTLWATHPFIAQTANGEKLLAALRDPEIQKIAVERHGFRSVLGNTMPNTCIQTAASISAMPLPTKKEMDQLNAYLAH
jgi:hypothetical protein